MIKDERYSNHLEYGNFVYYLSHVCIPTLREILFVDFDQLVLPVAEEGGLVQAVVCIDPPCEQRQRMPSLPQIGASREKVDVVNRFQVNHC